MTGYDSLSFTRQTAERIVADLNKDASGLTGSWNGDSLTFTATKEYDGEGFTYTVTPDAQGHYTIEALWPWDTWSGNLDPAEQSHAYARGALTPLEPVDPTCSDAARAAWQSGQAEAARLLQTAPTARQSDPRQLCAEPPLLFPLERPSMSARPDVVIARQQSGNITAEGGDELAAALLRRAGFVVQTAPRFAPWYRLPWDLGEERENQMAGHAAQMLTAVGYQVDLHPSLGTSPISTPTDPSGARVHGQRVRALTEQLKAADTYDTAASLAEQVLDPIDGVLARLGEFFDAAAEQANAADDEDGLDLGDRFTDAARRLTEISEDLHVADDRLRALGPPPEPNWQARLTAYRETAPPQHAGAPATVLTRSAATALPTPSAPRRSR
ncbi:hypothetical protein ACFXCZ_06000 [Streptomyces sp. NPDC059396]|uniref:hypothetical protein n=1 Tax=Streptomyces sp. NPDC059396 TaxID=3346819 RepID=UPI00367DF251